MTGGTRSTSAMMPAMKRTTLWALAFSLLALLASSCADRTALRLVIRSNLAVPVELDALLIQMRSSTGATAAPRSVPLIGTAFPQTLVVRPEPSGMDGTVTFTVQGLRSGSIVIQRIVSAAFRTGQIVDVEVELEVECLGVECGPGVDCVRGMCTGATPDAGMPDAGPRDAGGDTPAMPIDAFAPDAFVPGADAFSPDAFVRTDAFSRDAFVPGADAFAPDAFRLPDAFTPRDAFVIPDAFIPPDAYVIPDAFVPADAYAPPVTDLLINEIDYDQAGTDPAEFVEIVNVGSSTIDMSRFVLLMFNGSATPATSYAPSPIPLTGSLAGGQRLVVAGPMLAVGGGALVVRLPADSVIMNGDPDGVCVWDTLRLECVSAFSYGGGIMMATHMGRTFSLVTGTATTVRDSATAVRSLCRTPDLARSGNDAVDWAQCATPSPGTPN